jgi:hypothetical protein
VLLLSSVVSVLVRGRGVAVCLILLLYLGRYKIIHLLAYNQACYFTIKKSQLIQRASDDQNAERGPAS